MKTGKVKFYNNSKGFGFIVEDEGGRGLFVRQRGLIDRIADNDLVTYEVVQGKKGLNAVNVKKQQ